MKLYSLHPGRFWGRSRGREALARTLFREAYFTAPPGPANDTRSWSSLAWIAEGRRARLAREGK